MKRSLILPLTLIVFGMATEAQAYIDPGTGSMIIQMLIGASAAVYLFFKTSWSRIQGFFSRSSSHPESEKTEKDKNDSDQ